tara:strand:+ start:238 stop:618 length:381 start_codon:yes stop_codon:yes gene_type:complete
MEHVDLDVSNRERSHQRDLDVSNRARAARIATEGARTAAEQARIAAQDAHRAAYFAQVERERAERERERIMRERIRFVSASRDSNRESYLNRIMIKARLMEQYPGRGDTDRSDNEEIGDRVDDLNA